MSPDIDTVRSTALLLGPLVFGILQQLITEPPARDWHTKLNKSPYRPPTAVFPLVWTWSYLSLGYASYVVHTQINGLPLKLLTAVYSVHLILLNLWNFLFFSMRRIDYALNCLLLIDISASVLLVCVWTLVPFAAALCLPYFCWLLELTYLNIYMFRNNVTPHLIGARKEDILRAHRTPYYEQQSQVVPQLKRRQ